MGAFEEHELLLCQCKAELVRSIQDVGEAIRKAILSGNKVMLCGNGGSAADAQHIAAELIGRFKGERRPLPALALTTDSSILTAIGNDYSFDDIFSRQIRGMAQTGDVVIGISTSGNSGNVVNAVLCAKEMKCCTVALVGHAGGKLAPLCDYAIVVPSKQTARIQEMHITIGHILCELMEDISQSATNN